MGRAVLMQEDASIKIAAAPSIASLLGQVVEVAPGVGVGEEAQTRGLLPGVSWATFYKKTVGRRMTFQQIDAVSGQAAVQHPSLFGRRINLSLDPLHTFTEVLPPGVCSRTSYTLVELREKKVIGSEGRAASAGVAAEPTEAGLHMEFGKKDALLTQLGAGSGKLIVDILAVVGCLSIVDEAVPQDEGQSFVRTVVAGRHVRATIEVRGDGVESLHASSLGVGGAISTNPLALAAYIPNGKMDASYKYQRLTTDKVGPTVARIDIEGLDGIVIPDVTAKPLQEVLVFLAAKVDGLVQDPFAWQLLCVEVETSPLARANEIVAFIGNPGVGKSTLLNAYARRILFKSGLPVKLGHGLTYQLDRVVLGNQTFIDTPGLADIKLREKAADAISKCLRERGWHKIFFVVEINNGRISAEDMATMREVLLASGCSPNKYGIIVNQVIPEVLEQLEVPSQKAEFEALLFDDAEIPRTTYIFYNAESPDLRGKGDVLLPMNVALRNFINSMSGVTVLTVRDVTGETYEKQFLDMQHKSEELKEKARLREEDFRLQLSLVRENLQLSHEEKNKEVKELMDNKVAAERHEREALLHRHEAALRDEVRKAKQAHDEELNRREEEAKVREREFTDHLARAQEQLRLSQEAKHREIQDQLEALRKEEATRQAAALEKVEQVHDEELKRQENYAKLRERELKESLEQLRLSQEGKQHEIEAQLKALENSAEDSRRSYQQEAKRQAAAARSELEQLQEKLDELGQMSAQDIIIDRWRSGCVFAVGADDKKKARSYYIFDSTISSTDENGNEESYEGRWYGSRFVAPIRGLGWRKSCESVWIGDFAKEDVITYDWFKGER